MLDNLTDKDVLVCRMLKLRCVARKDPIRVPPSNEPTAAQPHAQRPLRSEDDQPQSQRPLRSERLSPPREYDYAALRASLVRGEPIVHPLLRSFSKAVAPYDSLPEEFEYDPGRRLVELRIDASISEPGKPIQFGLYMKKSAKKGTVVSLYGGLSVGQAEIKRVGTAMGMKFPGSHASRLPNTDLAQVITAISSLLSHRCYPIAAIPSLLSHRYYLIAAVLVIRMDVLCSTAYRSQRRLCAQIRRQIRTQR